jgi:hypothetical protein
MKYVYINKNYYKGNQQIDLALIVLMVKDSWFTEIGWKNLFEKNIPSPFIPLQIINPA